MRATTGLIGLLAACGIAFCSVGAAAAQPAGPPAGYTVNEEYTQKSPDGAVTIEQYVNKATDDWKWQFWARRQGTFTQLGPEQDHYPADFRFTNDLKWIVRVQKKGSGEPTLICTASVRRATCRDQGAARRPGMGLFEDASRLAKGQEGAGVSHLRWFCLRVLPTTIAASASIGRRTAIL